MVGPPKTLYDLRKVEASVRVTCSTCGSVKTYDLEELIYTRRFERRSIEWPAVQADLLCITCGHIRRDVHVTGVPFRANDRELRHRRAETLVMNLALTVLQDVARRARTDDPRTPVTRLALRVLRPYLADRSVLMRFWEEAAAGHGQAFSHAQLAHRWIVTELVKRGHAVWAEFR